MLRAMVDDKSIRQPNANRRSVVFVDIDNTLLPGAVVFLFAVEAWRQGFLSFSDVMPALFEQRHFTRRGETDERVASVQARALSLVRGHSVEQFTNVARATFENRVRRRLFSDVTDILTNHQSQDRQIHIVSASPQGLVDIIADGLGFAGGTGTALDEQQGIFTGELAGPLLRGSHKAEAARRHAESLGASLADCFALSDSIADLPLLSMVGHATAVNPDQGLHREALRRGWDVVWPEGTHRYRRIRSG